MGFLQAKIRGWWMAMSCSHSFKFHWKHSDIIFVTRKRLEVAEWGRMGTQKAGGKETRGE